MAAEPIVAGSLSQCMGNTSRSFQNTTDLPGKKIENK